MKEILPAVKNPSDTAGLIWPPAQPDILTGRCAQSRMNALDSCLASTHVKSLPNPAAVQGNVPYMPKSKCSRCTLHCTGKCCRHLVRSRQC